MVVISSVGSEGGAGVPLGGTAVAGVTVVGPARAAQQRRSPRRRPSRCRPRHRAAGDDGGGLPATADQHVDHDHGDVVIATVLVGPGHERLGCALRVRRGGEDGSHLLRIHLIAQAVAAEHEAVAGAHLELPEVDVHVGPDAEARVKM